MLYHSNQLDFQVINFPDEFDFVSALIDDSFEFHEIPFNPDIFDENAPILQEDGIIKTPKSTEL